MLTSAKHHTLIKSLLIGFLLIGTMSPITKTAVAATKYDKDRWFEVEVILFRQLGDKSELKEQFPQDALSVTAKLYDQTLNRKRRTKRVIELLQPFLIPDTSTLKLQLPVCSDSSVEQNHFQQNYFEQAATPPPYFQSLSLDEIEQLPFDEFLNNNNSESETLTSDTTINSPVENLNTLVNNNPSVQIKEEVVGSEFEQPLEPFFEPPSPEIKALVAEAEQVFSLLKFNLTQDHLPKHSENSQAQVCQLSNEVLAQLKRQDPDFDNNNFTVDKVPSTIDAAENVYSKNPYLLNSSSLQLNDIVKQLRWSKTFKPLLHLGWRLAPEGRNKAIPLHIFAGDNLTADYQQKLTQYNNAISAAKERQQAQIKAKNEQLLNNDGTAYDNELSKQILNQQPTEQLAEPLAVAPLSEEEQYQQAINARLATILSQLTHFDKSSDEIIDGLTNKLENNKTNKDKLTLKIYSETEKLEQSLGIQKPQPPLQPWFLEGLFKVHLNHYLYITADFTILNKTLAEQASDSIKLISTSAQISAEKESPLKLINFKQNRRVISQEIHYFDHPYLGMIVQIRRYKRPPPPIDEDANITTIPPITRENNEQ